MNKTILMNEYRLKNVWGKSIRLTNKWMTNKPESKDGMIITLTNEWINDQKTWI